MAIFGTIFVIRNGMELGIEFGLEFGMEFGMEFSLEFGMIPIEIPLFKVNFLERNTSNEAQTQLKTIFKA